MKFVEGLNIVNEEKLLVYVRKAMDTGESFVLQRKKFFEPLRLVCFDLDSTLIKAEILVELSKLLGKEDLMREITKQTMYGYLDFTESFTSRLKLLEGLPLWQIKEFLRSIPLAEGLSELMLKLKARGVKTAIITGNLDIFALDIKERFGFDYCYCTVSKIVERVVDGGLDLVLAGLVEDSIIDAQSKASILLELCRLNNISPMQTIAVGDGANDIPMLLAAGKAIIGFEGILDSI